MLTVLSSNLGYFEKKAGLGQAHPQKQLAVKVLNTTTIITLIALSGTCINNLIVWLTVTGPPLFYENPP